MSSLTLATPAPANENELEVIRVDKSNTELRKVFLKQLQHGNVGVAGHISAALSSIILSSVVA